MLMQRVGRPIEILLVEDNPGDVCLTREVLEEAMAFLRREGPYTSAPRPDLILLDLNLPRKSGREVLEEVKGDPQLKRIPVVIMTTSSDEKDILQAYNCHANCYVTKPVDLDQFLGVIRSIEHFWLTVVKLPAA